MDATKRKCSRACRESHPLRVFACQCRACGGLTHGADWMQQATARERTTVIARVSMEARRVKLLASARTMVRDLDSLRRKLG